jgi:uncharacterized protein YkwD
MKTNSLLSLLSVTAAAALTACGGGGGSGSTTPTPPSSYTATCPDGATKTSALSQADALAQCPVVVPTASTIVTSVPTPTYAVGSEELAAFNLLNAERSQCGFGLLKQNVTLDVSAQGHADWLNINWYIGHYQIAGTPGFTGLAPEDRMTAAGYAPAGSFLHSETEYASGSTKAGAGTLGVRRLLNGPYHLIPAMIRGFADVGVAVRNVADISTSLPNNKTELVIDYASLESTGMQAVPAGTVRTYPCQGSTNIVPSLTNERPSPVPDRNLGVAPLGSSIAVVGDAGTTLVITSALVTGPDGAAVTLRTPITSLNDPNITNGVSYFNTNEAFISADAPLVALTSYQVTITGTNNGVAFSRSFSFTTGN